MRIWAFLSMIGSLQLFDMVWILTGGGPANATTTMATYLITEGTKRQNYGIAAAASVILFVIALVMALVYQLLVLRRDTADGRSDDRPSRERAADRPGAAPPDGGGPRWSTLVAAGRGRDHARAGPLRRARRLPHQRAARRSPAGLPDPWVLDNYAGC